MKQENPDIEDFTTVEALRESRSLWLEIGRNAKDYALGGSDCIEEPECVDRLMQLAARAEACFWRAAGDSEAIDAERFLTPSDTPSTPSKDKTP